MGWDGPLGIVAGVKGSIGRTEKSAVRGSNPSEPRMGSVARIGSNKKCQLVVLCSDACYINSNLCHCKSSCDLGRPHVAMTLISIVCTAPCATNFHIKHRGGVDTNTKKSVILTNEQKLRHGLKIYVSVHQNWSFMSDSSKQKAVPAKNADF